MNQTSQKENDLSLLLVDDEVQIIRSLKRILRDDEYTIYTAANGIEGLEILSTHDIGVILSDINMPEMDGITFLENCRRHNPDAVRIVLTGNADVDSAVEMINRSRVFGYLTKPWSNTKLKQTLASAFKYHSLVAENKHLYNLTSSQNKELQALNQELEMRVQRRTQQLQASVDEGISMLAHAAEAKDDDTGEHISRIKELVENICVNMGLSDMETREISQASILHDVGKIHIPDHILKKPGPLSNEEFQIMKTHTTIGARILGHTNFYETACKIAHFHHEKYNGTGYPQGLKGEAIPLCARIVAVTDVFDALVNKRPYKPAWPRAKAIAEITSLSGIQFDPAVVDAFLEIGQGPTSSIARQPQTTPPTPQEA